jgi:hypothetical protein
MSMSLRVARACWFVVAVSVLENAVALMPTETHSDHCFAIKPKAIIWMGLYWARAFARATRDYGRLRGSWLLG